MLCNVSECRKNGSVITPNSQPPTLKQLVSRVREDLGIGPWSAYTAAITARGLWITTATHLHEHLGQLIAYCDRTTSRRPGASSPKQGRHGT